jgi:putative oxidoreductase
VSVVGVVAGAAEIALHGFPFFVFRANGAGASLTGLKEDQGPGQPDAPGAHRKVPAATPGATAKAHHPGAKSKGKRSHGTKPQAKQHPGTQHPGTQHPGTQHPGTQHPGTQHQGTQPSGQQGVKPGKSG